MNTDRIARARAAIEKVNGAQGGIPPLATVLATHDLPAALDALESARGALRRIAGMECAMMYDSRTCRLDWSPDDSANWCAPCIARAELDKEQG